ncbi:MAG: L-threonylcarbamoyladenylate synthase [Gemmatimonadota bacterium]
MNVLPFTTPNEIREALPQVVRHLEADGLLAYPTETVYGFGGAATTRAAAALRRLKQREPGKPFLLLVEGPRQAPGVRWTDAALTLARLFWPGPLTLVLPARPRAFPAGVRAVDGTVALRASPHPAVRAILAAAGAPLTSSSANAPRRPPALDAAGVAAALAALNAVDVLVLDGGRLPPSRPSTIVACTDATVRVLREGAIDRVELLNRLEGTGIHVG